MRVEKWEAVHAAQEAEEKNGRERKGDKDGISESRPQPFISVIQQQEERDGREAMHDGSPRQETLGPGSRGG